VTTQAAFDACIAAGTTEAQTLFNNFNDCLNNACANVSSTSTDPCLQTQNACGTCVTTGTIMTDMGNLESSPNGVCLADPTSTTAQTSPLCATCIPSGYACNQN
jgi:hypothetical protein